MKRMFDIFLAMIAILVLLPVLLLIALLIKLTMPGPVLFNQTRIGRKARPFKIYKFRSMKPSSSNNSITLSNDSRITPLGSFIRQSKLDELPQLFNIIKGDMSIVGPRPDVPEYYDTLTGSGQIIWDLRPGLTGLDSIVYPNEQTILSRQPNPKEYYNTVLWPHKVSLNLWYAQNRNFYMDLKIIVNTATVLIFGKMLFKFKTTATNQVQQGCSKKLA